VRLIAWNCRSGTADRRLTQLARYSPDVVFLQECQPGADHCRRINRRKAIALLAHSPAYAHTTIARQSGTGLASMAVRIEGPLSFTALGVWAQAPHYAMDVIQTLQGYDRVLPWDSTIVFGDFNSGPRLTSPKVTRRHQRLIDAFEARGLKSAYHEFHNVAHGQEDDPTYFHLGKRSSPWHIDFCFIPARWTSRLRNVTLVASASWKPASDHRALVVDLD
jgi:endonuclease/exonuclease/phosphatase family metal-dependent hydrolase